MAPRAHYVTTAFGQLRVWRAGAGPHLLVLPGLIRAAASVAAEVAAAAPDCTVTVPELPGTGGSAEVPCDSLAQAGAALRAAMEALGATGVPVLALDLAGALTGALDGPAILVEADRDWPPPPPLSPRPDGTHLTALFAHLRDAHVLDAAHRRAAGTGAPLPDAGALDASAVAAAVRPEAFAALWSACRAGARRGAAVPNLATGIARARALAGPPAPLPGPASARPPIWCDHADIPRGRVHLHRAGTNGRPLIALHSAPGSAAPLRPLLAGLADGWRVVAPDYLCNGLSEKPEDAVSIALLAADVLMLADALGFDGFDLWGTHTGALVALEAAIAAPGRVGRLVLEAPPLLPPAFTADILANYLPKLQPDRWGLHLQQAWNMRRDMFLFWPWYRAERAAARPLDLPDAAFLHDWTVGLLQSGRSYERSYRAAFEYDTRARLPLLRRPALVCAGPSDMLADGLQAAGRLAPNHITAATTPATVWYPGQSPAAVAATIAAYRRFLTA